MTIEINGQELDYTLENETTLGQVFDGLRSWLQEGSMLPSSLVIDGQSSMLDDQTWRCQEIQNTQTLSIDALNTQDIQLMHLCTSRDFFNLVANSAHNSVMETLTELSESYNDIKAHLEHTLNEKPIKELIKQLDNAGFPIHEKSNMDEIAQSSFSLAKFINARCEEFEDPRLCAQLTVAKLANHTTKLREAGVQFQTGSDKKAAAAIIYLTEKLQTLIRCLKLMKISESQSITENLMTVLLELENALKIQDTVQIADLLEYEITPVLLELPSQFEPNK